MRRLAMLLAAGLSACTPTQSTTTANLIGSHDLVVVDQLQSDGRVARLQFDESGNPLDEGVPGRFLYVTSADTNELRVIELYAVGTTRLRDFVRAPNPIETLSIPVLDRPTILSVEEGRNSLGQRVSGRHVFASRPGAAEISVVSTRTNRQLGGRPWAVVAPVTALAGTLSVRDDALPSDGTLYFATWDGELGSLWRASLSNDDQTLERALGNDEVAVSRVANVAGSPIVALTAVGPLATRTALGQPFCQQEMCLAIATRPAEGRPFEAFMLEPSTGARVSLGFGAAVRRFASAESSQRLYAVVDEEACGGSGCGGVIAVDLVSAPAGRFTRASDVLGQPYGPLKSSTSLLTGVTVASGAPLTSAYEVDGGLATVQLTYGALGALSSADGYVTFFDAESGTVIDYDQRRAMVTAALLRVPGVLPDGGFSLVGDGGSIGTSTTTGVTQVTPAEGEVTRTTVIGDASDGGLTVTLGDGFFVDQELAVVNRGLIPGLVDVATSASEGASVSAQGLLSRVRVGDSVLFSTQSAAGLELCGATSVRAIVDGRLELSVIPPGCEQRVAYSVRAGAVDSQVIAMSVEGFLGRAEPGAVFTYNRPLALIPPGMTSRPVSLSLTLPLRPPAEEGAYWSASISGRLSPYRVSIDTNSTATTFGLSNCASSVPAQVLFGNMAMFFAPRPTNAQGGRTYAWSTFTVVQSGNAVLELYNSLVIGSGVLLNRSHGDCYR